MPGNNLTQQEIVEVIREEIARQKNGECPALSDDQSLHTDLALTSLDIVELLAGLESRLGAGSFNSSLSFTELRSVGDLFRAYCPDPGAGFDPACRDDSVLQASRRRGEARLHS
jgi:acyl carrier protein